MHSPDVLLLLPILLPVAGAALVALCRRKEWLRNLAAVGSSLLSFVALGVLYYFNRHNQLSLEFVRLIDYGLSFRPTNLGMLLAVLAGGLWTLGTLYALVYMKHEHSPARFFTFLLLSMSGCVGVFLAGDYFTLFLFFEVMTFAAYPLVIHEEDDHAMRAGDTYLYMSVAGGLVLLFGIFALVWITGTADIAPALDVLYKGAISPYVLAGVFVIGFGVKAGLIPMHIWLPQAHPVAPSPASALLSGVMIKTGAYGILTFLSVTLSSKEPHSKLLDIPHNIGYVMIWVALMTMIGGALMALMQDSIKKILAYSSVSQMGYIMLAVGCAAYLGEEGGLSYTAAVYHAFNHAVFKAGLFMMIGTIYLRTHTLSLSKLGGMSKYLPFTTITTLIASLAVLGLPGFSGFASKTLIHHAIVEAAHHSNSVWLLLAEKLFIAGSAITAAYFIKLYTGIFFGQFKGRQAPVRQEGWLIRLVLGTFAGVILFVGIFPYKVMHVLEYAAKGTVVDLGVLEKQLHHVVFWEVHAYGGVMLPAVLGIAIYFLARYAKFFTWNYPKWLSVESFVYRPLYRGFLRLCCRYVTTVEGGICDLYDRSGTVSGRLLRRVKKFDDMIDEGYEAAGRATTVVVEHARSFDYGVGKAYSEAGRSVEALAKTAQEMDSGIHGAYSRVGNAAISATTEVAKMDNKLDSSYETITEQATHALDALRHADISDGDKSADWQASDTDSRVREVWNPQNITLGSLILAVLLLVVLVVLYIYGGNVLQ